MFDDFQELEEEQEDDIFGAYEPEEPEGLQPPRHSTLCLGHEQIEAKLLDLINSGNMPHAMIFAGPVGIGKSTMAFRLARYLLKHGTADSAQDSLFGDAPLEATSLNIPSDDPVFSKVAAGGHPDLLTLEYSLEPKKAGKEADIDVYTARKVAPFLRMTSADGGWRVVIIDNADRLNRNAQNALLKILEEPPSNALLILVTHRLGAMIPTIRSRCRVMNFDPLKEEALTQLMQQEIGNTISGEDRILLSSITGGSMGLAQKFVETGGLEITQSILGMFERWPDFNKVDIHHLSDSAGRAGQDASFDNIERVFLWVAEQIIFAKAKGEDGMPSAPLDKGFITSMCNTYTLPQWLEIFENLRAHFSQARFSNLDKKQAVLHAFNLIKP